LVLLAEVEHGRLTEIDHALAKFDSGEYGLDEDTGEPISFARLSVIPWARYAAQTQEEHDRRRGVLP
jgi:DnaK suppressor protein